MQEFPFECVCLHAPLTRHTGIADRGTSTTPAISTIEFAVTNTASCPLQTVVLVTTRIVVTKTAAAIASAFFTYP